MGYLQRIQQFAAALLPEQTLVTTDGIITLRITCYGEEDSGLPMEKIHPVMEWVSLSIYNSGYRGRSHVFWLLPKADQRRELQRLYRKGEMVMGYRLGDSCRRGFANAWL